MSANQIVTKDINEISLTSVFIEEQKFGWSQGNAPDCASVSSSFATSAIAQCSSAPYQDATNGQCMCDYNTAAFPTQVENYTIAFSHTYTVHWDQGQETWTGSSKQTTSDSGYVMETTVVGFPNGTIRTYEAGEEIALTVQEILEMAEYEVGFLASSSTPTRSVTTVFPCFHLRLHAATSRAKSRELTSDRASPLRVPPGRMKTATLGLASSWTKQTLQQILLTCETRKGQEGSEIA